MSDLYLIYKNLTRKKIRLFLLLISIITAFLIYVLVSSFANSMNAGIDLSADDRLVVVNKINFTQVLPYSYYNRVKSIEEIEAVSHLNWFGGYYQDPKNFIVSFAVSPDNFLTVYQDLYSIDSTDYRNFQQNRRGLLVGRDTAEKYGWQIGDQIPLSSNIFTNSNNGTNAWEFTIEAIFDAKDGKLPTQEVYFQYQYFNESSAFGRDNVGFLIVKTKDANLNEQVINTIDSMFANSFAETETMPEKAFNKQFVEQLGNISLIIQSVIGAAFFTILVLVGNSMMMAIRERTKEIAVLKTIGFSSRRIFFQIIVESITLAVIGGTIGCLVALLIIPGFNQAIGNTLPPLMPTSQTVLSTYLYMLLLGLLTGIIPAINALKLNVVKALTSS